MRKNFFIFSIVTIAVMSISIIFNVSCDKKNINTLSEASTEKTQNTLSKHLPIKMEKINTSDNAKTSVNLGTFISGEDYKYFKQNYSNTVLKMNEAEIYAFPDYTDVYAIGIPFIDGENEGGLIIYKNLKNNKEFSVIKKVIKNVSDTIVSLSVLRNPDDAISITFSKGGSSINLRPGCKDDPDKPCYEKCSTWSSCVKCTIDEINNDPLSALACMAHGPACAILIATTCTLVYL